MVHTMITHIVLDEALPTLGNRKQVSPICSTIPKLEQGIYFNGYNGSMPLKLADVENDKSIHALPEKPLVREDCTRPIKGKVPFDEWPHIGTFV